MKLKKPNFWDYKKPNLIAYLLLPLSFLVQIFNFFKEKQKIKIQRIKTICIGNIYLGGTGKTPLSIKINEILNNLNFKTAFIKKNYINHIDEKKLLSSKGKVFFEKDRIDSIKNAIDDKIDIVILDDGLQDKRISYDISFVCFNIQKWVGNGLVLPSGPLRENLNSLKKYDAIFLNGNGEDNLLIQNIIKKINPNIKIFEGKYEPIKLEKLDLNSNYLAFSGIGNPESFLETLKKNKIKVIKNLNFPDHYNYSHKDISNIKKTAKDYNANIITTEKDFKRIDILNSKDIEYLEIILKIKNENELINFLNKKL